jgi:hypothetical protein
MPEYLMLLMSSKRENKESPCATKQISLSRRGANRTNTQIKANPTRNHRKALVSIYSHQLVLPKAKDVRLEEVNHVRSLDFSYVEVVEENTPKDENPVYWGLFCDPHLVEEFGADFIVNRLAIDRRRLSIPSHHPSRSGFTR